MTINQVLLEGTLATELQPSSEDDEKLEFLLCRRRGLDSVELFPVQLWAPWAEPLAVRKGEQILVLGELREERWVEERTREKRRRVTVHAIEVKQLEQVCHPTACLPEHELGLVSEEDEIRV